MFDKGGKNIHRRKDRHFNRWCWGNWAAICKRMKLENSLIPYKVKSRSVWFVQPHRRQPTRLPHPSDSPGKKTGVGCHLFSNAWKWKVKVKSLSHVWLFATPWTVAYQAPPSREFSRQEYWSGLPFPSPGDLPNPRIEPGSPTLQADTLPSELPGKPIHKDNTIHKYKLKMD